MRLILAGLIAPASGADGDEDDDGGGGGGEVGFAHAAGPSPVARHSVVVRQTISRRTGL